MCSMGKPTDNPRRSSKRRPRARAVMLSAAAGALIILGASVVLNWEIGSSEGPVRPAALFDVERGTCLNWNAKDAGDIRKVPCHGPYLFQVTGKNDLSGKFGENAPYPKAQRWQDLKQKHCEPVATRFLGGKLDPHGRINVGAFTPSRQAWASGDRTLQCGLQQPGASGKLYRLTGHMRQQDQSNVYEPGRCLGINGTEVHDPVDCAKPHAAEITGVVDLSNEFGKGYPAEKDQDDFLATRCGEMTAKYAGGPDVVGDKKLVGYWDTMLKESWEAGSRKVNCKVSAQLPDGSGLAPVTGSIRGEVNIGKEPAPEKQRPAEAGVPANQPR